MLGLKLNHVGKRGPRLRQIDCYLQTAFRSVYLEMDFFIFWFKFTDVFLCKCPIDTISTTMLPCIVWWIALKCFSPIKMFAFLSIFHRALFPWVQSLRKKKFSKNMLSTDTRFFGAEVICIYFSQCCIFCYSFGCHSKCFTIKSQGCFYAW